MRRVTFSNLAPDNRPEPRTEFERALHALLHDLFRLQPVWATQIGFHAYDDRWPNVSESGRQELLAVVDRQREVMSALDPSTLASDERIDRGLVIETLDAIEFAEGELRDAAWDPLSFVQLAGYGFFGLLAREFAPWQHRGSAFVGRLDGLAALLTQAADGLTGVRGRPVSLLHTQTALAQLAGITDLIDEGLAEAGRQDDADLRAQMEAAAGPAREAVDEFRRRLTDEIQPRADGDGRLGRELFGKKLRHTLASDLTPEDLRQRAERDYDVVRAEMLRLARDAWTTYVPDKRVPEDDDETIRTVLDAVAREHRQPHELLDFSRAEVARIEQFCRDRDLIGLGDEPMQITWTPVFMRAYGRAFLSSPGPLDKGLSSYFWITPPDESLGPEATESYLREDNDRMLRLLAIHEGVPGHYLQGAWANRSPSLARAVFASGTFAEGWAVYVTQVLMDLGYGDHEPALLLSHWKFYLRAITNALMDVAIHCDDMAEEQAMALMVGGGFQEQDEARAKWLRARLTSTQLSTYYVGSLEMWDLEEAARRRAAEAAGAKAGSVPAQRVVGGLGDTPGFDYRTHLESVISHGTPPIKWVRRAVLGEGA
jgi:uncharacterized protein (DUF885 family)